MILSDMKYSYNEKDHFSYSILKAYKKVNFFRELQKHQWLSPDELHELSCRRLQTLVKHAYDTVPFYQKTFNEHGIKPSDISDISDLQKIPILTKKTLQQGDLKNFLAQKLDIQKCLKHKTSGSTGMPLTILTTFDENLYGNLTLSRAGFSNGKRPWHKQAFIHDQRKMGQKSSLRQLFGRTLFINAGQDADKQLDMLSTFNPDVICGYNNSLKLIAKAIKDREIKSIHPKAVFGYAELLDQPNRNLINDAFGVDMIDIYASTEGKCIAWECSQHQGYHINFDTVVVEFLRNGKPAKAGEPGRIIITPLFLYSMPLIRYDLGDIGILSDRQCRCGRGLPLMEMVKGRCDDFITLASGNVVAPVETFATIIENEADIHEYLVIQQEYDLIEIKLVDRASNGNGHQKKKRIKSGVEKLTGHEARVKVEFVDRIDRNGDAKLRRIISRVPFLAF